MTIPSFDFCGLKPHELQEALWSAGCLQLKHPLLPASRCRAILDVVTIGGDVLSVIAQSMELPADHFVPLVEDPYLLMKWICYHPQQNTGGTRPGVAPHLDFRHLVHGVRAGTDGRQGRMKNGRLKAGRTRGSADVPPA